MPTTVLVDGRVEAHGKVDVDAAGGRIRIRPFARLPKTVRGEIEREGMALLEAMGERFANGRVEFEDAGSGWDGRWS